MTSQGILHPSLLHPLTGRPLHAVGHRRDGRLIWPIMGGSETPPEGGTPPAGTTPPAGETPPAGTTPPAGSTPPAATPPAGDTPPAAEKVEDLPEWAQKIIRDTRAEAATNRTGKTAAEEQQQKILKAVAQAAGLKIDDGDDTPTAEQLAEQLTTAQTEGREAKVELAVFKAAIAAKADPVGLTDSRTFMTKVGNLDPAADDFATKVKAEIETAVKDNPKLQASQAPASSSADHPGGSGGGSGKPTTLEDAIGQKLAG